MREGKRREWPRGEKYACVVAGELQHAKGLGEEKEADVAVGKGEAGGVGAGGRSGWKVTKLSRGGMGERERGGT